MDESGAKEVESEEKDGERKGNDEKDGLAGGGARGLGKDQPMRAAHGAVPGGERIGVAEGAELEKGSTAGGAKCGAVR